MNQIGCLFTFVRHGAYKANGFSIEPITNINTYLNNKRYKYEFYQNL